MKKSTMIAAVFAASAFSALAADVYSSNIVGYTKVSVGQGFNLLGTQFVKVGGTLQDINDVLVTDNLPGLDAEGAFQTTLRVWDGVGYTTYGWCADGDGTANEVPEFDAKWLLFDQSDVATLDLSNGTGFWVVTTQGSTVTFSGEVSTSNSVPVSVGTGFNLVCNPFPTSISIQDVQSSELPGLDGEGAFQTTLKVWDGVGYTTYGWCADGDGTANEVPEFDAKWLLFDQSAVADVTIGVGQGFWIVTTQPSTITFTK